MRARIAVPIAIASTALGAGVAACADLFHSTDDIRTACEIDATTAGCQTTEEAGVEAGTDFCGWTGPQARQNAQHACAWLGACETPLGRNAFGSCMFEALLAYDCHANPAHPVRGTTHDLWDCLWQAETCGKVNACVFPQGPQTCGGGPFVVCASLDGGPPNADVRAGCALAGAQASGENCRLWGQTCGGNASVGVCGGNGGDPALACPFDGCDGTRLHWCSDAGTDIGIDCLDNGAQQCRAFPTSANARWVACLPQSDASTCTPDASATCVNGVAISCPAGIVESLDCNGLLSNAGACNPGALSPTFDWTSPCAVVSTTVDGGDAGDAAVADAAACAESCNGTKLNACYRGASFPLDCTQVGLLACRMVSTNQDASVNAACTPP